MDCDQASTVRMTKCNSNIKTCAYCVPTQCKQRADDKNTQRITVLPNAQILGSKKLKSSG